MKLDVYVYVLSRVKEEKGPFLWIGSGGNGCEDLAHAWGDTHILPVLGLSCADPRTPC